MAQDSAVTEDARDLDQTRPPRPAWTWFGAGLLVGAGLAVLVVAPRPSVPVTATTLPGPTTGVTVAPGAGLGDTVPAFPDGLVAVVRREGQSQELVVWPVGGAPYRKPVPVAASTPPVRVGFDTSGGRIATLLAGPNRLGGLLYAGVPESATLVASQVTGYAWHDSAPARLAYTTAEAGETFLWVAEGNQTRAELVTRAVGVEGGVLAWGDWGFAVESGESILLLTASGEIKTVTPGRLLASHNEGWMLIEDGRLWLLSAGGGLVGLERVDLGDETALAAAFSPDGGRLALVTPTRLLVFARNGPLVLGPVFVRARVPAQLRWSSDSRFLLTPVTRGLQVWDVDTGVAFTVLEGELLTGVGVLPLSRP